MKILIMAEHASAAFGGEAALPLHYFRILRRRGHDVWLIVHERTRQELAQLFPDDPRIIYTPDTLAIRALWKVGSALPQRIANFTTGYAMRILTQRYQVRAARKLIAAGQVDVIHQPMPVSPREPSLLYGLDVPVVIGPMNGGMSFPPAFKERSSRFERLSVAAARALTNVMNRVFPGKRRAAAILVANERTRLALPAGVDGKVFEIIENGVDLSVWKKPRAQGDKQEKFTRFVFVGRLVDWKGVDLLLRAFKRAREQHAISLLIIGDGPERPKLEAIAGELGILSTTERAGTVSFAGWISQDQCAEEVGSRDALVLPSLYECGGAVVLEAMALERPVIATDWGGPQDYLDPGCGILVPPASQAEFVTGLEKAMLRLASSPELRAEMGRKAALKIATTFDWEKKVDAVVDIYAYAQTVGGVR